MNGSNSKKFLQLEVKDFGPVFDANIELRPLTVFIGPSNTGKSYLAILIYALHKVFNVGNAFRIVDWSNRIKNEKNILLAIEKLVSDIQSNDSSEPTKGIEIPGLVINEINKLIELKGTELRYEIVRNFGIQGIQELIRYGTPKRSLVNLGIGNATNTIEHVLKIDSKEGNIESRIPENFQVLLNKKDESSSNNFNSVLSSLNFLNEIDRKRNSIWFAPTVEQLLWELHLFLYPETLGILSRPAYYLPADRTGVMHAHRVVVSSLIKGAPMAGLKPDVNTPMLSGVLADFLNELVNIDENYPKQKKPKFLNQAHQIEKNLMSGGIKVTRSELVNYPHFKYKPEGWKRDLSLMNSSSMVSELAPLVLYLRHVVEPGNILIVEEPESHLHPAKQVEFTRQLAELVKNGLRVIITTHSEWVLEELANIVQRSKIQSQKGKSQKDSEISLTSDQVGAWLFKPKKRPKGSIVEEIKLDEETGLYPSGFDTVSESLYNESVSLFNRIHQQ